MIDATSLTYKSEESMTCEAMSLDQEELKGNVTNISVKEKTLDTPSNRPDCESRPRRKVRIRLIYDEVSYFETIDESMAN